MEQTSAPKAEASESGAGPRGLGRYSIARPTFVVATVCIVGVLDVAKPAHAQEDDYIYCARAGGEGYSTFDTYYYTAVILGDYGATLGHENDFHDYLKSNDPALNLHGSYCYYESSSAAAEESRRSHMAATRDRGYRVVPTNWTPATGGGRTGAGSFSTRPIQDFHISVPATPYELQVCARDHECEDGDRIRVSVNGSAVLGGEIFNAWSCTSVSLREGRHDIELYAVNGTGYKGDCSYVDGNSGELRVTGQDSQTQSWRHRAGKGSRARLVVTVR